MSGTHAVSSRIRSSGALHGRQPIIVPGSAIDRTSRGMIRARTTGSRMSVASAVNGGRAGRKTSTAGCASRFRTRASTSRSRPSPRPRRPRPGSRAASGGAGRSFGRSWSPGAASRSAGFPAMRRARPGGGGPSRIGSRGGTPSGSPGRRCRPSRPGRGSAAAEGTRSQAGTRSSRSPPGLREFGAGNSHPHDGHRANERQGPIRRIVRSGTRVPGQLPASPRAIAR